MRSLLEEARLTFRATVWVGRWKGLLLGIIPLYWINFWCIKENGEPFTAVNRLILLAYYLMIIVTGIAIPTQPWWVCAPLAAVTGFMMGRVLRWLNEP